PLDAGLLREHERFGDGDVEGTHDRVDGQLHRRAGAVVTHVEDTGGEDVKDRPGGVQVVAATAGHDGELAALDNGDAAGDWGVQVARTRLLDELRDPLHGLRVDR